MHLLDYRVDRAEEQTARRSRKLVAGYQGKGARPFLSSGEQRRFCKMTAAALAYKYSRH
jgi:hypothetical protein